MPILIHFTNTLRPNILSCTFFLLYKRTTVFYCNLRTRGVYASGISSSRYNVKLNFVAVIPLLKELI